MVVDHRDFHAADVVEWSECQAGCHHRWRMLNFCSAARHARQGECAEPLAAFLSGDVQVPPPYKSTDECWQRGEFYLLLKLRRGWSIVECVDG